MDQGPRQPVPLAAGSAVEVHGSYSQHWSTGFEIVSVEHAGCRLRRVSDGAILPVVFSLDDVRRRR